MLPEKILNKVDKLNRDFIWGSTDTKKKKLHLVSWKKITKPKSAGGLGLMAAKPNNLALAAKLCWRFKTKAHEPWAQVLKGKYPDCARPRKYALSRSWLTILKGESICNVGFRWLVGNNCSLNFWSDTWLKIGNIRSLIVGPLHKGEGQLCINNLLVDGVWLLHLLSFDLPLHIALSIRATPIRIAFDGKDTLSWNSNVNGGFDTKDAYLLAAGGNSASHCFNGK
jgi:hypothetical protein